MSLSIFKGNEVKFPSGEPVEEYVTELSSSALRKLEYMTYPQEKNSMDRYMNMYNAFYGAASTNRPPLSAQRFASKTNVRAFVEEYAAGDDVDETNLRTMKNKTAESILHFLFVYYFSYHEYEESTGKRIPIVSFATWFGRLRAKLGRKMRKEMEAKEKAYNALTGIERQNYADRLRAAVQTWKKSWRAVGNETLVQQFNQAARVVSIKNMNSKDWWVVFGIAANRIQTTGASTVRKEVTAKYRRWSRFFHPDRSNNQGLGTPFRHLLSQRFLILTDKKDEMQTWFDNIAIEV